MATQKDCTVDISEDLLSQIIEDLDDCLKAAGEAMILNTDKERVIGLSDELHGGWQVYENEFHEAYFTKKGIVSLFDLQLSFGDNERWANVAVTFEIACKEGSSSGYWDWKTIQFDHYV